MKDLSKKQIIDISIASFTILALLLIDIVTKLFVHNYFHGVAGSNIVVIDNFFWIYLTYNKGALASFLADVTWGRVILSILSIIGSILSTWYLVKNFNKLDTLRKIALYLFIPGCTGNLIDRVGLYRTEGVIDFLRFRLFGFYDFPIFNFADMCLTVSIILFFVWALFFDKDHSKIEKTQEGENNA